MRILPAALLFCLSAAAPSAGGEVEFERDVAPLVIRHCVSCHNAAEGAGKLDLTRRASALAGGESGSPAIVPGDPGASYLIERLRAGEMPPEGKGRPPAAADVVRLEAWIASGAAWPETRVLSPFEFTTDERSGFDWWSLQKPRRPAVPAVKHAQRVRTPIDSFVLTRLETAGLEPAPEAVRRTYIRRVTLDLLGLPPSPEEVAAFVADTSPDAHEKLVDRLLASPRYGERWARHWLDVVRFGESNGYETNTARKNAWPYRDWVIAAFNDDLPYPEFVAQQLAGDQLGADAATGFLVGGAHDTVASPDVELTLQQRANDLDDMISTTAGAFLGLTAGCARCHDHKFDPVTQRDYYALAAVFAGVQHGERELRALEAAGRREREAGLRRQLETLEKRLDELVARHQPLAHLDGASPPAPRPPVHPRWNVDRFEPQSARFVRFTVLATNSVEPCLDEVEVFTAESTPRNAALAGHGAKASASNVFANGGNNIHQLAHVNDGQYGNGHSWISSEPGGGWVQIELPEAATIDRVVWARDREGNFADRLPTRYRIEVSPDAEHWRLVATGDDRRPYDPAAATSAPARATGLPDEIAEKVADLERRMRTLSEQLAALAPAMAYLGTFKQPDATHVLYRGEPMQKREAVSPGAIAAVGPLSLAADAPEAQRRIALARWIASPDNPLAARVMVNRIWHYHFGRGLVATPSDFGFGGGQPSHPELLDWLASEFMANGGRAKAIHRLIVLSSTYRQSSRRDSKAAAIDADNRLLWRYAQRRLEAEAIRDGILKASGVLDLSMGGPGYDVFEPNTNYVKVYQPKAAFGPAEWRRMIYQDKPRLQSDAAFGAFDCPDASQQVAKRNVSTTALQALNLLNAPFMLQQSELFAKRLVREAPDTDARIQFAFRLALARDPDDEELTAARQLVAAHGLPAFCRALFNANEFLYVD